MPQLSVTDITNGAVKAVVTLLADTNVGFNIGVSNAMSAAGISPLYKAVDFNRPGTGGFFKMELTEKTIDSIRSITYPAVCVYTFDLINRNIQKPEKFSGVIRLCVDVWESWKTSSVPDVDATGGIIDAVMVDIFNRDDSQSQFLNPLVYDGNINCRKGTPTTGGDYWRRKSAYGLTIQVHQQY